MNCFLGVGVGEAFEEGSHFHLDSQFLGQFPDQARLIRLTRLAFPPRKFPQPAQMRLSMPPGDEEFAVFENQPGRNFDDGGRAQRPMLL